MGLITVGTPRDWQHTQDLPRFKPDKNLRAEKGKQTQDPHLLKKLCAIDPCWEREISSSQWGLWVYQPHSRQGLTPRSSWPTQSTLHIFLCALFDLLWYFFFFLPYGAFVCLFLSFAVCFMIIWGMEREQEHELVG